MDDFLLMMLAMEDDEMEAKDELDELCFEDDEDEFCEEEEQCFLLCYWQSVASLE